MSNSVQRINRILLIAVVALLLGVIGLGSAYVKANNQVKEFKAGVLTSQQDKIVSFGNEFVEKVLKANSAVNFDDRLKLENDVRALNDKDILDSWQKFTSSNTETDAQSQVKSLLDLLFQKL